MKMEQTDDKLKEKKPFSERLRHYVKNILDFSQYDKKTIVYIIFFIFLIGFSIFLLCYVYFIDNTLLYRIVIDWFVNPIVALGFWGIFLFIAIMAIQGLIIPIPSEILLLATGLAWGLIGGGIMGVIGSMSAALLCYYLSRKGGRPLAKKFVGEKAINLADNFIHKYGMGAIILARLLPFIAFDPISYTSGLVDISTKKYVIGTFIGSIPRAFFYSWLGSTLGIYADYEAQAAIFNIVLLIILGILAIMFFIYYILGKYYGKKIVAEKTS